MSNEPIGTIWVCDDCMFTHANGETGNETPDREPWSLETGDVTMGTLEHNHVNQEEECDCAYITFSWSSCEGCGSTLGGSRHAFTVWSDDNA